MCLSKQASSKLQASFTLACMRLHAVRRFQRLEADEQDVLRRLPRVLKMGHPLFAASSHLAGGLISWSLGCADSLASITIVALSFQWAASLRHRLLESLLRVCG